MSTRVRQAFQSAAGAASGGGLNVEDVFSTYLYTGTGYPNYQTITNGIDLAGEGGLIWTKNRTGATAHHLVDTERGVGKSLETNTTNPEQSKPEGVVNFYNDGYRVYYENEVNQGSKDFASWTFRKAPKFFDVVTWTGNGQSTQTISHSLGSAPGFITIKATGLTQNWWTYHRSTGTGNYLTLNTNNAATGGSIVTATSSSDFTVGSTTTSTGYQYVAYLFAHNDGDGEFGPTGDQDIIKCGSHTQSVTDAVELIDLGWEAGWILTKRADAGTDDWVLVDNMRGLLATGNSPMLRPNLSSTESLTSSTNAHSQGFTFKTTAGQQHIYIAIRRGPMAVPENATDVFAIDTRNAPEPAYISGFPVDMAINRYVTSSDSNQIQSRLTGTKYMWTDSTSAEYSSSSVLFDYMNGWHGPSAIDTNRYSWMWRRAPSFFDVVTYTGRDDGAGAYGFSYRSVNHSLGVSPELMIVKSRSSGNWFVYASSLGNTSDIILDSVNAKRTGVVTWNNYTPDSTTFQVNAAAGINTVGTNYIAYLFASLDGISKVGSYTGNGTSQNIDCGFSNGARFVLVKRADAISNWVLWDSERGIVAGNDPFLLLNSTSAQISSYDSIDPYSGGFAMNETANNLNVSGGTYIFYAIA